MASATWMASSRVGVSTSACTSRALEVERLEDRQGERGRLAGAGLRLPDDVAPGEQRGDRARLDGRGRFVADLGDGGEECWGKAEVGEGGCHPLQSTSESRILGPRETAVSRRDAMVKLEFHDPSGAIEVTQPHAPRLAGSAGKRIGFVSNEQWQAYRMLPLLKALLEADFPGIEVLPIDAFPQGNARDRHGGDGGARQAERRRRRHHRQRGLRVLRHSMRPCSR